MGASFISLQLLLYLCILHKLIIEKKMSANTSDRPVSKVVEKAIVDKKALVRSAVSTLYSW